MTSAIGFTLAVLCLVAMLAATPVTTHGSRLDGFSARSCSA